MNIYKIIVGKPEGKRPLRSPICWWIDNTKMDLRVMGWGSMFWIDLARDKDQWKTLVDTVMKLKGP
jgi:hypothetical protein